MLTRWEVLQSPEVGPWPEGWGPAQASLALGQGRVKPRGGVEGASSQESVNRVLLTHKTKLALK